MNIKTNFVNRNELATNQQNPKKVDAQKIIDYYISLHPLNRVRVNSPLYNLAIQQYNENIKNTLVRPDVPEWFCGKINPDTGELVNQPTDQQSRASAGVISDPLQGTSVVPVGIQGTYDIDECLQLGTSGSHGYSTCKTGKDARDAQELVDEWLSSMESVRKELGESAIEQAFGRTGIPNKMDAPPTNLKQTMTLTVNGIGDGKIRFTYSPYKWPSKDGCDAMALFFRKLDGKWNGGKFEWIANGGQKVKLTENIMAGYNNHTIPANGEQVAFMWISIDRVYRSNLATAVWHN